MSPFLRFASDRERFEESDALVTFVAFVLGASPCCLGIVFRIGIVSAPQSLLLVTLEGRREGRGRSLLDQ